MTENTSILDIPLYSESFARLLTEEIFASFERSGETTCSYFSQFTSRNWNCLTERTMDYPSSDNVLKWIGYLVTDLNRSSSRRILIMTVNRMIDWSKSSQGYTFWHSVCLGISRGLNLCWLDDDSLLQLTLTNDWGRAFLLLWNQADPSMVVDEV